MAARLKKQKARLLAAAFFLLFFLYGCFTVKDYGITWDEGIERQSTLTAYKYMFPSVEKYVTESVDFSGEEPDYNDFWSHYYGSVGDYKEYKDRYYGVAAQLPTAMIEHLFGFQLSYRQAFLLRHVYTFLLFFAACICFYVTAKCMTGSVYGALLGTLMLILSPRILADSYYNIKDSVFLSIWIMGTLCGIRFIRKPGWKTMLLLAVVGGICTNVRIVGAILFVIALPVAFCKSFQEKQWKRTLLYCLGTGVISVLVYILVSPITWENPIEEIFNTLKVFSSYVTHTTPVYYLGEWIALTDLPWHYLFVWIGMTTPVLYLVFAGIGLVWKIVAGMRKPTEPQWDQIFVFLTVLVPLVYVLVARPVLYNGWRHFFFIYPAMILFALFGILLAGRLLRQKKALFYIGSGVFFLYLLSIGGWILKNHPFEYMYFNYPSRSHVEGRMEKDYWSMGKLDAFERICKSDDRDKITFWTYFPVDCLHMLSEENAARLTMVDNKDDADYIIHIHTLSAEEETAAMVNLELFDEWYRKVVDGASVYSVYKHK